MTAKSDLPQGTLDLLILKVVALGPVHGYAIAQRLQQVSRDVVQVPQGSLYPALHRLENRGLLAADWRETETGRDAKFYRLTKKGRARLERRGGGLAAADRGRRPHPGAGRGRCGMSWLQRLLGRRRMEEQLEKRTALPSRRARRRPRRPRAHARGGAAAGEARARRRGAGEGASAATPAARGGWRTAAGRRATPFARSGSSRALRRSRC